jgi:hypothetical protein
LLALRGWGPEHFRRASPELLAACRWALAAEQGVVMLAEAEHMAATVVDTSMPAKLVAAALEVRHLGEDRVKALRAALFPEDDDG